MKKSILLLCTGLLSLLCGADLQLVKDGRSDYVIALPMPGKSRGVDHYLDLTAQKLQSVIKESTGVQLPIFQENQIPKGRSAIFIGNTHKLRRLGVAVHKAAPMTAFIKSDGKNIYLAGLDRGAPGTQRIPHYNSCILGSVRAAVLFMEEFLKVEFLMPGETGTNVNKQNFITIPGDLNMVSPSRHTLLTGRDNDLFYDMANSNFGFGDVFHYRGHSWSVAVSQRRYGKSNPEYFALLGGKRDNLNRYGHLCISNPAVQDLIYKEALRRLDAGARVVQVAQTDGYRQCECKPCQAFGGVSDPGEKIWILNLKLAQRLKKERPGKFMQFLCYYPNYAPPESFDAFPGNVFIEFCAYPEEQFKAWSKIKGIAGYGVYIYNWGEYKMPGFLPKRGSAFLAEQAKLFHKYNVKSIYRCGHGELYGLEGPGYYVHARMLQDPSADFYKLRERYIERTFLEAALPMKGFYDLYEPRLELYSTLEEKKLLPKDPRVLVNAMFSPELVRNMELKLKAAEKLAKDPKVIKRIALVTKEFNYLKSLITVLNLYNAYQLKPAYASFNALGDAVEAHKALVADLYDSKGQMKQLPGWQEIRFFGKFPKAMVLSNGRNAAPIGAPLNWNIKFLKEKKILPGAKVRSMVPVRVQKAPSFDFTKPEWQKGQWQQLNHIQLGKLHEQTRFKMLYDNKNVYFGIISELPAKRKFKNMGHDGDLWWYDGMEILLDPVGAREVSYHFICNPLPNSWYEGALGLIKDPLHPRFGKEDKSWNGKWSYETRRKGDVWEVLITIPYTTLNTTPPVKGTVWTMNVARQSYPEALGKAGEVGLWSPNLENLSISDNLNAFGEVRFQ